MHLLRSSAIAAVLIATVPMVMAPVAAQAQAAFEISVGFAPPPLPIYDQPPIPGPDYIWTPGYWAWDPDVYDYYWVPGTWTLAPQPGLLWTPPWWGWANGGYGFHEGYWGHEVGYYGGVAYGFGYDGAAYQGGYWQNNHFFYNSTVNNVRNTRITNVYQKTVVINRGATASFNGPGGATARPTAAQLVAEKAPHVAPTALQTHNVKAAAATPTLRASANHGAPPVAATAKPGAFSGPGVVKTAHSGGAYQPPAAAVQRQAEVKAHGVTTGPVAPGGPKPEKAVVVEHGAAVTTHGPTSTHVQTTHAPVSGAASAGGPAGGSSTEVHEHKAPLSAHTTGGPPKAATPVTHTLAEPEHVSPHVERTVSHAPQPPTMTHAVVVPKPPPAAKPPPRPKPPPEAADKKQPA
jgi:YXWGXW repeat-containing protein